LLLSSSALSSAAWPLAHISPSSIGCVNQKDWKLLYTYHQPAALEEDASGAAAATQQKADITSSAKVGYDPALLQLTNSVNCTSGLILRPLQHQGHQWRAARLTRVSSGRGGWACRASDPESSTPSSSSQWLDGPNAGRPESIVVLPLCRCCVPRAAAWAQSATSWHHGVTVPWLRP
jgi:hypothetical protein